MFEFQREMAQPSEPFNKEDCMDGTRRQNNISGAQTTGEPVGKDC